MEECNICLTKIKKRNKNKHEKSKKHKFFFSNLIINNYIVRNEEINRFKDILQSFYDEHKNKFDNFTVWIIWKIENQIVCDVKLPDKVIIEKQYFIPSNINWMPMLTPRDVNRMKEILIGSCVDYSVSFYDLGNDFCDEISIIFISYLEDISFFHYIKQPKSMLCRKLVKKFIKEENLRRL